MPMVQAEGEHGLPLSIGPFTVRTSYPYEYWCRTLASKTLWNTRQQIPYKQIVLT